MDMDIDWDDPMKMFGFTAEPQQQQQSYDETVDDENFYGEQAQQHMQQPIAQADAQPGASAEQQNRPAAPTQNAPAPPTQPAAAGTLSPQQKAENERQLQLLKAKLLAKRQNTPSRPASTMAQVGTPTPAPPQPLQLQTAPVAASNVTETKQEEEVEIVDGMNGIDALLDQGKAMAEARSAAELANASAQPTPIASQHSQRERSVQQGKQPVPQLQPTPQVAQTPQRATNLSDEYYADLPAWLEMTGYHDVAFRNSKLSVVRQRRELERQAAEIAEQIEKIKQKEQETMIELRTSSTPINTTNMAAPPLPKTMPTPQTNGTKRGRSPDLFGSEKARRQENGGFRIRGANESPTDTRPPDRRFSRSPPGLDRRISYPDARRRSTEGRSRDPSLERRQSYYRRDGEPGPPTPRYNDHWAPQSPRDGPRPKYPGGPGRNNSYTRTPQYTGSASLNLRKGGQPNGRPKPK